MFSVHKFKVFVKGTVGEAAKPEAVGGDGGQQPGEAEQGETDRPEQRQPADPLPVHM